MATLDAARAAAGTRQPRVVFVEGEPGMGKTALLHQFGQAASASPVKYLACDRLEQVIDYGVVDLLRAGEQSPVSPVMAGRQILAWLDGLQSHVEPVVLLLDDVQWMDMASVEAIRFALRRLAVDRVLVVLARRPPTADDPWSSLLADSTRTVRVSLPPLSSAQIVDLARAERDWYLDERSANRLLRHTGGVPLLVQAYLQGAPEPAAWSDQAALPVPDKASSIVGGMLAPLDQAARLVVDALAVLGEMTDMLTLGRLPDLTDSPQALSDAVATGLVCLNSGSESVDFVHALYRDTVYEQMQLPRKRRLHAWAAEQSRGDRALVHRLAAATQPSEDLCADLIAAARRARAAHLPALAATHHLRARRVATGIDLRDKLLLEAVLDRLAADDLPGATELTPAIEDTQPGPLRSLTLGTLAHRTGRVEEARDLLTDAVELASEADLPALVAQAGSELGMMFAALNEGEQVLKAVEHIRRALADSNAEPDPNQLARTRGLRAVGLWEVGRLPEALDELADVAPTDKAEAWEPDLFATRGLTRHWAGDLAGASADLDYAISLMKSWGPSLMRDRVHAQRALTRFVLGDWDAAAVDARAACALAESGERPWMISLAHGAATLVPANRGDWAVAETHLRRAQEGQARRPSAQGAAMVASAEINLAQARRDWDGVRRTVARMQAEGTLDRIMLSRSYRWAYISLCEAMIATGQLDDAEKLLSEYAELARGFRHGAGSVQLGWLRGMLAEAHRDPESAELAYAEDLADPSVELTPFPLAGLLLSSGRLQRLLGRRREAIDLLTRARTVLIRLRAQPMLERVLAELEACGLRAQRTGPLQLTEREQDVAGLVATGLTNGEVAAELFLTSKTVEYHLRNIFIKLNLSNRRELRRRWSPD